MMGSFVGGSTAAMDAVGPADEGNVAIVVRVVLNVLDDSHGKRCSVALEVDGLLEALHSIVAVESGYAAAGGQARAEVEGDWGKLDRERKCLL